jgi:hypothetical protein
MAALLVVCTGSSCCSAHTTGVRRRTDNPSVPACHTARPFLWGRRPPPFTATTRTITYNKDMSEEEQNPGYV